MHIFKALGRALQNSIKVDKESVTLVKGSNFKKYSSIINMGSKISFCKFKQVVTAPKL